MVWISTLPPLPQTLLLLISVFFFKVSNSAKYEDVTTPVIGRMMLEKTIKMIRKKKLINKSLYTVFYYKNKESIQILNMHSQNFNFFITSLKNDLYLKFEWTKSFQSISRILGLRSEIQLWPFFVMICIGYFCGYLNVFSSKAIP